ncbi:MAG: hypothetical protein IJS88_05130 [Alphaproteobacteria bacterium]|nr:hypothetical protein [Alphaproteobacteria bacterium]
MSVSDEEKVQKLQENFQNYKNFRRKNEFNLQKEILEYQSEADEYRAQGDQLSMRAVQTNIKQTENTLQRLKDLSQYVREPTLEDYAYRRNQYENFAKTIQRFISEDELLCFHGTNIAATKHIFESGNISSGASRLGYHTSFDAKGAISVTSINMVDTSVQSYMNLIDDMYLPAGCLFVVKAKDADEYESSISRMSIKDVDFKNSPERLVAVITTPENEERVNTWVQQCVFDASKVMTFESFIKECKQSYHEKITNIKRSSLKVDEYT